MCIVLSASVSFNNNIIQL